MKMGWNWDEMTDEEKQTNFQNSLGGDEGRRFLGPNQLDSLKSKSRAENARFQSSLFSVSAKNFL